MARTGRFGRQPRSYASLTNTLVAIAREFQNQRSQNIMDAWMKGGTFEGKKATDELVLKFWKERMEGVSKDDPLYDTYKNAHSQLDYSIHESKMTAWYAQSNKGPAEDRKMVNFYLGWAKKVPKNSEFYRVLQRDAGQYIRQQQARSKADIAAAKERRYQKQMADIRREQEAAGEYIIDELRNIARSGYVNGHMPQVISGDGDLTQLRPSDAEEFLDLINAITLPTTSPALGPEGRGVIPTGKEYGNTDTLYHMEGSDQPQTGVAIMDRLAKLDPGWQPGQPFDVDYVVGLLDRQLEGLDARIKLARETGHMSDVANLQNSKSYVSGLKREAGALPTMQEYNSSRGDYDAAVEQKGNSPYAIKDAWNRHVANLQRMLNDPAIQANDALRNRIQAEIDGKAGVPSLKEDFTGLANDLFNDGASDIAENTAALADIDEQIKAVESGGAVWTYGEYEGGVFVPKAGGTVMGAATQEYAAAGGVNPQVVMVPDPLSGRQIPVTITAVPIYGVATEPRTGDKLASDTGEPIGYAYDFPDGKTQYGFNTAEGFKFSEDPPWGKAPDGSEFSLKGSKENGNHLELDLTPLLYPVYGRPDPVTGQWAEDGGVNLQKSGNFGIAGFEVKDGAPGKDGVIVFNPQKAAWATDTRDGIGASDPITDFASLTLSRLIQTTDGRRILTDIEKYPSMQEQIDRDNVVAAGGVVDKVTGQINTANVDQNKLGALARQTDTLKGAKTVVDWIDNAAKSLFQRSTTASGSGSTVGGNNRGSQFETVTKLATDLLQGTPFEQLGSVFQPGTNSLKPQDPNYNARTNVELKAAGTIKVPGMPSLGYTPPQTTTTVQKNQNATTGTQQQQGSAPPTTSQQGSQAGSTSPYPYWGGPR